MFLQVPKRDIMCCSYYESKFYLHVARWSEGFFAAILYIFVSCVLLYLFK
jgi:hypothetical protein